MPAYNEEPALVEAVEKMLATMTASGLDFEIIIVDDCSRDGTAELAQGLAGRDARIKFVRNPVNLGIGGAFRTGVEQAVKDYVILVPCDNPLELRDLESYLPRMNACDIVVGVRAERVGYHPVARFGSFVYNRVLVPLLFNIGIADVNWIQAYRRAIFGPGGIEIEYTGIFFLVETLVKARHKNLIIAEVPSHMRRRLHGTPTSARYRTMWTTFWDMMEFFFQLRRNGA